MMCRVLYSNCNSRHGPGCIVLATLPLISVIDCTAALDYSACFVCGAKGPRVAAHGKGWCVTLT